MRKKNSKQKKMSLTYECDKNEVNFLSKKTNITSMQSEVYL